jgi:hypothetical protein
VVREREPLRAVVLPRFRPPVLAAPVVDVERRVVLLAPRAVVFRVVPRFAVPRLAVPRFAVLRFAVLLLAVLRLAVLLLAVLRFAVLRLAAPRLAVLFVAPRFVPPRADDLVVDPLVLLARVRPALFFAAPRFAVPRLALFVVLRPLLFRPPPCVLPALVALAPRVFTLAPREVAPALFRVRVAPVDVLPREAFFVPPDACERVAMLRS